MTPQVEMAKAIWENRNKIFIVEKPYSKGQYRKHYKVYIGLTDITPNIRYFNTKVNDDGRGCIWFRKPSDTNNIHQVVYNYLVRLKKVFKSQEEIIHKKFPII